MLRNSLCKSLSDLLCRQAIFMANACAPGGVCRSSILSRRKLKNATSRSFSSGKWCSMPSNSLRRPPGVSSRIARAFMRGLSPRRSDGHCPATFSNAQAARQGKGCSPLYMSESRASNTILSTSASAAIVVINVLHGRAKRRERKLSSNDSDGFMIVFTLLSFHDKDSECREMHKQFHVLIIFMKLLPINKSTISSLNQEKALTLYT